MAGGVAKENHAMFRARCKIWIERDGRPVFGDGRAALLAAIDEAASLSAAARKLGIPYRTAWKHLQMMERAYGQKITDRQAGGASGGTTCLTEAGRRLLAAYTRFRRSLDQTIQKRFQQAMRLL